MTTLSKNTITRLTQYLELCNTTKQDFLTSQSIATLLKIGDAQVRKDLSFLDSLIGTRGKGYNVESLKKLMSESLKLEKPTYFYVIGDLQEIDFEKEIKAFSNSELGYYTENGENNIYESHPRTEERKIAIINEVKEAERLLIHLEYLGVLSVLNMSGVYLRSDKIKITGFSVASKLQELSYL